eukprot:GHRQ01032279.1.p1 GENE.GHRQ01032279.1~~GHRQ01032279.1.p1  ORF type:complete len:163 (+),score=5.72 GHRQ01032279.1:218-706(+)
MIAAPGTATATYHRSWVNPKPLASPCQSASHHATLHQLDPGAAYGSTAGAQAALDIQDRLVALLRFAASQTAVRMPVCATLAGTSVPLRHPQYPALHTQHSSTERRHVECGSVTSHVHAKPTSHPLRATEKHSCMRLHSGPCLARPCCPGAQLTACRGRQPA